MHCLNKWKHPNGTLAVVFDVDGNDMLCLVKILLPFTLQVSLGVVSVCSVDFFIEGKEYILDKIDVLFGC